MSLRDTVEEALSKGFLTEPHFIFRPLDGISGSRFRHRMTECSWVCVTVWKERGVGVHVCVDVCVRADSAVHTKPTV